MIQYIQHYPAIFETNEKQDGYSVFLPDIPGCVSAGDTFDEARKNIIEALSLHISGMIEDKIEAPIVLLENAIQITKEFPATCFLVMVEPDRLLLTKLIHGKSKTISSTIDEYVLELSDKKLKELKLNRSKLFEQVLLGVATNTIPLEVLFKDKIGFNDLSKIASIIPQEKQTIF